MKLTGKCPKCGSTDIILDAKVVDAKGSPYFSGLGLATFRNPDALFLKGKVVSPLSTWVCSDCGFTEFYADSPKILHQD